MEIILMRHGKPKVELKGYLSAKELKCLIAAYAKSSIQDMPTEKSKKNFNDYFVVCSDLPRSIESAKRLGFNKIDLSAALFKEVDLPHFNKSFIKLPVTAWLIILRLMWLFGFSKNGESFLQAKALGKQAAEKLINLALENKKIIVVGHGLINRLIEKQLQKKGWRVSKKSGRSYWEFRKCTKSHFE